MSLKPIVLGLVCTLLLAACVPDNNVYYPDNGGRYRPSYDRYDRYDYDRERDRDRDRWERDRDRWERERDRHDRDRDRHDHDRDRDHWGGRPNHNSGSIQQPKPDGCQSGFRLRGSKCSDKERKRGCKDSRSQNGGQYCVSGV